MRCRLGRTRVHKEEGEGAIYKMGKERGKGHCTLYRQYYTSTLGFMIDPVVVQIWNLTVLFFRNV